MILITAMTTGIFTGAMRSAFSVALVAALICLSFAAAAAVSPGPVSILSLAVAIAGYNAGLIAFFGALIAFDRRRTA
ncbi:hypothetical protein [Rhizobium sp. BK251]|uniref:hypothetical protein n=1 Tax=Rhizobium sp. BK251 TaxID=2512125 RepID=UPI00104AEC9A|nr:hypothetical protein [Rhizobium sp. BK251]TCL72068.1 hypothetical protein EV286_105329 [Rhizobium sp. BK251]